MSREEKKIAYTHQMRLKEREPAHSLKEIVSDVKAERTDSNQQRKNIQF